MNVVQKNVVNMNVKNPYMTILSFLDYKGENKNTRLSYERDIKDFFLITRGKEISDLTVEDLNYTLEDVVNYRRTLQRMRTKKGKRMYVNKSINRKISVIYNLFVYFKSNDYVVNPFAFKLDALPEVDSQEADAFTWDEVEIMVEQVKKQNNGLDKAMCILLAATTSIRLNALINLKWSNIVDVKGVKVIKVYDKGNKVVEKPIQDSLYEQLLQLKGDKKKNDRIFSLTARSYQDTVKKLVEEMGLETEDRKLTFHSLRKAGVTRTYELTNSFDHAREQGNHSNPQTTVKYLKREKDYTQMGSYLIGQEIEEDVLDDLTKEELLELIKSNKAVFNVLVRMAKER